MMQVVEEPIKVTKNKVTVNPTLMEIDKLYRFEWGGVTVFALKRELPGTGYAMTSTAGGTNWVTLTNNPQYQVEFYAEQPKCQETSG